MITSLYVAPLISIWVCLCSPSALGLPHTFLIRQTSWSSSFHDWIPLFLYHLLNFCMLIKQPTTAVFNPIQLLLMQLSHIIITWFKLVIVMSWTLHSLQLQVAITVQIYSLYNSLWHTVFSISCVLTSPLVTVSNGGHSPSSGFLNCLFQLQ
jgi:hypothetical protein